MSNHKGDEKIMKKSLITEDKIREIMEQSSEDIKESIESTVVNAVIDRINWKISDSMDELVKEFIETEIVPEIKIILAANKNQIIEGLSSATIDISKVMFDKMVENATKNLIGYKGDDIMKKLLG